MYQYKIDLTSMPPIQEERYKVVESFEALYWDVRMHMEVIDHLTSQKNHNYSRSHMETEHQTGFPVAS